LIAGRYACVADREGGLKACHSQAYNFLDYEFPLWTTWYTRTIKVDMSKYVVYAEYCWVSSNGRRNT